MLKQSLYGFLLMLSVVAFSGCTAVKNSVGNVNLFTIDQDKELGAQVNQQILGDPAQFPVLPEQGNEQLYKYIRDIRDKILNSGAVQYKDDFAWEVRIIDDRETLNAFATPGGYIYVYTGLMDYLESEDELAGVMGHEIAHADRRHSTKQMTKSYGVAILVSAALGEREALSQIVQGLASLKNSRGHESDADNYSVFYLCNTEYNAAGAAGFFEKLLQGDGGRPPEFLSTHPNPDNRVASIHAKARELGCTGKETYKTRYENMKKLIP